MLRTNPEETEETEETQKIINAISKYEKISSNLIRIIQTHISRVFITPKFVYKQKKTVNFGFVDYSSLEKRRFFARRELSLNRRACSGIYIDLQELRQNRGGYFIGFQGGILKDIFVRMRYAADERFLNNILDSFNKNGVKNYIFNKNKLDVLKKVAKRIYLFHKNANSSKRISGFGKAEVYTENWDDNFLAVRKLLNSFKDDIKGQVNIKSFFDILNYMEKFYNEFLQSVMFNEFVNLRIKNGFIRDLHGDLRMEHIAVIGRERIKGVCLMDCVEFNEKFRNQDLYLDTAFLLMDFEFHGFFYESAEFFDYYKGFFNYKKDIEKYEKYEPFIIPFFKAYRSVVRTKIDLLSGRTCGGLKHLNLALFYIEFFKKPVVILNIGLSGSGKTNLSDLLASYFYAKNIKSDRLRQEMFGFTDKIFKYGRKASETVYDNMFQEGAQRFNEGKSVIFDATFLKKEHREKFISYFEKKDCNFVVIYSKIYEDKEHVILKRLEDRQATERNNGVRLKSDPKDSKKGSGGGERKLEKEYSEAGVSVYLNQKKAFEEPEPQDSSSLKNHTETRGFCFITVDASLELSERFNYVMKKIKGDNSFTH
ncbi:MAG: AAA family ATPase [Deltaproteobacteria bacterium]|nr:AAA family ATPase [Deltaproteobacteria bacterium]